MRPRGVSGVRGFLAGVLLLSLPGLVRAVETPGTLAGNATLEGGVPLSYRFFFDANALVSSCRIGNTLLSATRAGVLLGFSADSLKLLRQSLAQAPVTCLARVDQTTVLAGLEDGRIVSVDPGSLETRSVGRVDGNPLWIGTRGSGERHPIVVFRRSHENEYGDSTWHTWVRDLRDETEHRITCVDSYLRSSTPPTAFRLVGDRLWLGVDRGEWGGSVGTIELGSGKQGTPGEVGGVYGFQDLSDGTVLVFGGLAHMTVTEGYVSSLSSEEILPLATFSNDYGRAKREQPPAHPVFPVVHVVELSGGKELLVVSYGEVYRCSRDFQECRFIGEIEVRYRQGRPNAVGAFPSLRYVELVSEDPITLRAATLHDGWLTWSPAGIQKRSKVPGQLEGSALKLLPHPGAPILDSWHGGGLPQRLGPKGWSPVTLCPDSVDHPGQGWLHHRIFAAGDGSIVTAVRSTWTPGHLAVTRWKGGEAEVLHHSALSTVSLGSVFFTADGTLWSGHERVTYLEKGNWVDTGEYLEPSQGYEAAGPLGTAWLIHATRRGELHTLTREGTSVKIERLELGGGGRDPVTVHDLVPWKQGYLVATSVGVRRLTEEGKLEPTPFVTPEKVTRLCRTSGGDLWFAGEGLYHLEHGGEKPRRVTSPELSRRLRHVDDIAGDPDRPGSVWIALGWGVLHLQKP